MRRTVFTCQIMPPPYAMQDIAAAEAAAPRLRLAAQRAAKAAAQATAEAAVAGQRLDSAHSVEDHRSGNSLAHMTARELIAAAEMTSAQAAPCVSVKWCGGRPILSSVRSL